MDPHEVRQAWDDVAETYADRRDPDGSDAALIDDWLATLPATPDVLDVGCGDGARTLRNLPAGSVGLDISRRGLELARETVPTAQLVHGEMSTLPFAAERFDGITAYQAVFHVRRERHPGVYDEFAHRRTDGEAVFFTRDSLDRALTAHLGERPHRQTVTRVWDKLAEFGGDDLVEKRHRVSNAQQPTELLVMDIETAEGLLEKRYRGLELLETSDLSAQAGGVTPVVTGATG